MNSVSIDTAKTVVDEPKLEFNPDKTFENELRRRVAEYFRASGRSSRGNPGMYLKTAAILFLFAGSYTLLVFFTENIWQGVPLAIFLGFTVAGIGFNIQHDGGHNAYSSHRWVNKIMAMTLDLIGASSYIWRWKHVVFHHRYVNITGYDPDVEVGGFGRVTPHHKLRRFHRWQHVYLWPAYGLIAIKWQLFDDFKTLITGRIANHRIPRPKKWDLVIFIMGKIVYLTLAFGIPLLLHPFGAVIFYYIIATLVLGMLMSVIFQLPHCVPESDFPVPHGDTGQMVNPWAVHQVNVTLDFARNNPVLTWALGGLNYHAEHHLFPVICHVHYPAISQIVQATCRDFGIRYKEHKTFLAGLVSHFKWLRLMGRTERAATP